jgi:hypothetical protein
MMSAWENSLLAEASREVIVERIQKPFPHNSAANDP